MKNKPFNNFYIYYIDSFNVPFNGHDIVHLYVADKNVKLDKYTKLVTETETFYIFETNVDGVPRQLKGYKSKDLALKHLKEI